jgi:hypothetical protein
MKLSFSSFAIIAMIKFLYRKLPQVYLGDLV